MIKNLYLFRHGQTNHNAAGVRYGGAETGELTELGIAQAKALSQYLANTKIDVFYSSPYERAMHTARIVAKQHNGTDIIPDDRLAEVAYWWDDDNTDEIVDGKVKKHWILTDEMKEQRDANFARIKGFFDDILVNSKHENVAIASHGGVTRALLMACGYKIGEIKNCELFHLTRNGDTWEIVDNKRW